MMMMLMMVMNKVNPEKITMMTVRMGFNCGEE